MTGRNTVGHDTERTERPISTATGGQDLRGRSVTDTANRARSTPVLSLVVANAGKGFNSLTPTRLFDTRVGYPQGVAYVDKSRFVGPGNILSVYVGGMLPDMARAVSLNVTVANAGGQGFVTVFPCGTLPNSSNLNYTFGQVVPNAVTAPMSANGYVCFYSSVNVDLIADINGWFAVASVFTPLDPFRVFDTRPGYGQGAVPINKGQYGGANVLSIHLAGVGGIPSSGVGAVSLNVTAIDPIGPGFVTVFPCGSRPDASNLNYTAGQVVPNAVVSPLSPSGDVCFFSSVGTHLIADVNGWFTSGSSFASLVPSRVFDTRPGYAQGTVPVSQTQYGGANVLRIHVAGVSGIPASGVGAVSLNVTAIDPVGPGFVTVYPCGSRPDASNLNYTAGQVVPNAVMAPVSASGDVCFFSSVNTHLIADVNGWFSDAP